MDGSGYGFIRWMDMDMVKSFSALISFLVFPAFSKIRFY